MKRHHKILMALAVLIAVACVFFLRSDKSQTQYQEIKPTIGDFVVKISATGTVTPENRIVVTSPTNGRIEKILVDDGQVVKRKQILAWMSSQDRAALMDAAQTSNEARELIQMYKPTPIVAPEGGQIISKQIVRGQNVGTETVLFEISDRLIFVAKVDETDLGKIALDQPAQIRIDAFPNDIIEAKTHHIVHQSSLNNNITTYDVFVEPTAKTPANLRSGMSITVDFILSKKEQATLVPSYVTGGKQNARVILKVRDADGKATPREVQVGASNGESAEIISGLKETDVILYQLENVSKSSKSGMSFLGGRPKK